MEIAKRTRWWGWWELSCRFEVLGLNSTYTVNYNLYFEIPSKFSCPPPQSDPQNICTSFNILVASGLLHCIYHNSQRQQKKLRDK